MKQRVYRGLSAVGLPRLLAWANRGRAVLLMYHGFTDRRDESGIGNSDGLHLHVDVFREHLRYLREHFHPISLETLLDHLEAGRPLPPRSVVLTFDDGYRSNYELAYPLLREFETPATIFLTTGFVDGKQLQWTDRLEYALGNADPSALRRLSDAADGTIESRRRLLAREKARLKRVPQERRSEEVERLEAQLDRSVADAELPPAIYLPLDWEQVREMRASGLVSFGNHTVSHFILSHCRDEVIRREIQDAKALIERRMGEPCPLFCYPNGGAGDFDARTRAAAKEAGHRCALVTLPGHNGLDADPFELRRVGVMEGHSHEDFVMAVAGVSRWSMAIGDSLRRLRRRA